MALKIHANGVREIQDRLYGSDFKAVSVPPSVINDSGFKYDGICRQPHEIDADIVFNWSTFDACAKVNTGLRIGGTEVKSYNLVNYAPFLTWAGGTLVIDHKLTSWNKLKTAAQGVRYVIQGSVKNTNWDHSASSIKEWSEKHPRQLVGVNNGITYIISVRGRDTGNVGWTLHEAAEYGVSLGLQSMIDGDGGGSVSTALRYPGGERKIFRGVLEENRAVPVFGYINLAAPLDTLSDPPPPPPNGDVVKTHDIDVFTDGSIAVDGVKYVP